jgi:hypothetical protein
MDEIVLKINRLKERFPNANFSVSCFKTIEEIETKILCDDDVIIYCDEYLLYGLTYGDRYVIKKRQGEKHIYYYDVIDHLIKNGFVRNDTDHRFMENIREFNSKRRNEKSIKTFSSFWGS